MSAGAGGGGENESDFELNLAPIIDCFTVLITYMLVSASFISLDILNIQVATTSDQPVEQQPQEPQAALGLEIGDKSLEFKITGKEEAKFNVDVNDKGEWDPAQMEETLKKIQKKWPSIKDISVKAQPAIEYRQIVKAVENLKQSKLQITMGE